MTSIQDILSDQERYTTRLGDLMKRIERLTAGRLLAMQAIVQASHSRNFFIKAEDHDAVDWMLTQIERGIREQ